MNARPVFGAATVGILLFLCALPSSAGNCPTSPKSIASCCNLPGTGAAGTYTLTADLSDSSTTVSCITFASGVTSATINLYGHNITTTTSSGSGISGASTTNVLVYGPGLITGFGGPAITLGTGATVQEVTVVSNGSATTSAGCGINVGNNSTVTRCIADSNGNSTNQASIAGINCGSSLGNGSGCIFDQNNLQSNAAYGLAFGSYSGTNSICGNGASYNICNNVVYGNAEYGLDDGYTGSLFDENVMY